MRGLLLALAALAVSVSAESKFTRTVTKIKCDNGCSTTTVTYTTGLYTPRTAAAGAYTVYPSSKAEHPTHSSPAQHAHHSATHTVVAQPTTSVHSHRPVVSQIRDGQVQGLAHDSGVKGHFHTPAGSHSSSKNTSTAHYQPQATVQSSSKSELKHTITSRIHKTATLSLSHPTTISGVWYPSGHPSKTDNSTGAKDATIMTGAAASASWSGLICLVMVAALFVWA